MEVRCNSYQSFFLQFIITLYRNLIRNWTRDHFNINYTTFYLITKNSKLEVINLASLGYCPICKKNVVKEKGSFSFLLAFILAFTGIGLVIYILYYIDQKPKYCEFCHTLCQPPQLENKSQLPKELENVTPKLITDEKVQFCYNCGTEIEYRHEAEICNFCGDNIV